VSPTKGAWLWSRDSRDCNNFAVCSDAARRAGLSATAELLAVFSIFFSLFFVSLPCARLSWPSRQLLSARKYTISLPYRIDGRSRVTQNRCPDGPFMQVCAKVSSCNHGAATYSGTVGVGITARH